MNTLTKGAAKVGRLVADSVTADNLTVVTATFTVGTEATNAINVAIQLKDGSGVDLARRCALPWYLSADANGDAIASAAPSGGIAIGTDGLLLEWTNNLSGLVISEADGDIDVTLTETSTPTFYLVLVLPGGKLAVSGAITFA